MTSSAEKITLAAVEAFRARSFRLLPGLRVRTEPQALEFIRQAGIVLLWVPGEQLNLPCLSAAYPQGGKDFGWWPWKQTLPEKKACYYAKILRHKGTFLSWDIFPCFQAVYANRQPYEEEWRAGLLPRVQKRLLDILTTQGPLMTKELRLAYGPPGKANTRLVKAALDDLQRVFRVCPAGGDTEGWSHHRWDLVERWVPSRYLQKGRSLEPEKAGAAIIARFLRTVGASTPQEICWLFSWKRERVEEFLHSVAGLLEVEIEGVAARFISLRPVLRKLKAL